MILYIRSNMINWLPYPAPILKRAAGNFAQSLGEVCPQTGYAKLSDEWIIHSFLHEKLTNCEIRLR